jgi:hypothetical protein
VAPAGLAAEGVDQRRFVWLADGGEVTTACRREQRLCHRFRRRAMRLARAGKPDRRAPVIELAPRVEVIRLAAAVAEAAVIEEQCGEAGRGEALRRRSRRVPERPCAITTTGVVASVITAG